MIMTFVPNRMNYCLLCLQLVSIFVVATTISHQVTRIEEKVNEQLVLYSTSSSESRILLHVASSYHNSNHDNYDKAECVPRSHRYDNTVVESTQATAPDIFRVQWTLTTTTETTIPTTALAAAAATTTKISTLTMQFNRTWSPIGVDRMYQLILDHYFDCAVFFRVVPGTKNYEAETKI